MPSTTSIGTVSNTEISYLDSVTSNIQTQLNSKQATLVSATNVKTVNGTSLLGSGNLEIVSGGGLPANSQTFTTSGTFTVPVGVTKILIQGWHAGGGGGGMGYNGNNSGRSGGGGASVRGDSFILSVTEGQQFTVTIGSGGAGGAYNVQPNSGGTGGTTTFGSYRFLGASGGTGGAGTYNLSGGGGGSYYPSNAFTTASAPTGGTSDGNNGESSGLAVAGGKGGAGLVRVYW
jgi:phage-related tail fiber protein